MMMRSQKMVADSMNMLRDIQWDSKHHSVTIGKRTIVLTATQYQFLWPLRHGVAVTYAELVACVYQCKVDLVMRGIVDKHIDRIRNRLRGTGMYIYCVRGYGYLLFPQFGSTDNEKPDLFW